MEAMPIYKKDYHVDLSDIDFTKKLKLSALFNYLQDIASLHADNLGLGLNKLEGNNTTWVLIRIRADIIKYPVWNEDITIETWPQEPKKYEFERDYIVRDTFGNIIIRAISVWIILDTQTRQLTKSDYINEKYPEMIKERAIGCKLLKLKASGTPEIVYKKVISYSDIDINGHLNNSKYVDFIMDCFSVESHKKYIVKTIQINYINEALPGDSMIMYRDISALDTNTVYIEGIKENSCESVFKAQVEVQLL